MLAPLNLNAFKPDTASPISSNSQAMGDGFADHRKDRGAFLLGCLLGPGLLNASRCRKNGGDDLKQCFLGQQTILVQRKKPLNNMAFAGGVDDRGVCVILYFPYLFCDGKPSVNEIEKFIVDPIYLPAVFIELAGNRINMFIILI
jgi:hypothetical protein